MKTQAASLPVAMYANATLDPRHLKSHLSARTSSATKRAAPPLRSRAAGNPSTLMVWLWALVEIGCQVPSFRAKAPRGCSAQ